MVDSLRVRGTISNERSGLLRAASSRTLEDSRVQGQHIAGRDLDLLVLAYVRKSKELRFIETSQSTSKREPRLQFKSPIRRVLRKFVPDCVDDPAG